MSITYETPRRCDFGGFLCRYRIKVAYALGLAAFFDCYLSSHLQI